MGLSSGTRLGPYEILASRGAGGMGEVYRARDTRLDRVVAIKVLPSHLSSNPDLRIRFQREARSISGLQHPNICVLYDIGSQNGIDFLVMEYLEGETLQARLERGPLPPEQVCQIGIQVSEALERAHRQGIVHRDMKPGNIMLTPAGAKLMDFGLAKAQAVAGTSPLGPASAQATLSNSGLTMAGAVVGTVPYMSPEQIRGREADARSDIFSLGVVLYEAITGRRPFCGTSLLEIASEVLHADPKPPSQIASAELGMLEPVILKALAKDPEKRYQSAQELTADLRAVEQALRADGRDAATQRTLPRPRGEFSRALGNLSRVFQRPRIPVPFLLAGALVSVIAIFSGVGLWRHRPYQPAAETRHWYNIGTNALRDGAYYQASKALERALAADGNYALARARLAEAQVEMDRLDDAKDELLRITATDRPALSKLDSLYLDAITATARQDFSKSIELYRQIAQKTAEAEKPYVLADLGRAYEKSDDLGKAVQAYGESAKRNPQYATAFLHLGILYGRKQEVADALASFDKAEGIYQAAGNLEGRAEVAFQRGALFNQLDKMSEAKSSLEQALTLARAADNKSQEIKTMLQLSSVAADVGQTERATEYAHQAVDLAQKTGMETLAARGLVDLGNSFMVTGQYKAAEKYFVQALGTAQQNKARRNEARARLSLASLSVQQNNADKALGYLGPALDFYQQGGYRKESSLGLALLARANLQKGDYATALKADEQLLRLAEQTSNQSQVALAHTEIASALALQERFPEALAHLNQAYPVYKSLGVQRDLVYNLLARGNALWQLGRYSEAAPLLDEASAIADRPAEGDPELSASIKLARAEMALSQGHFSDARGKAEETLAAAGARFPATALGAKCVLALAQSYSGDTTTGKQTGSAAVEMARQLNDPGQLARAQLAQAETLLRAGDRQRAFSTAVAAQSTLARGLQQASEWRALLVAALASRNGPGRNAQEYASQAKESLARLEQDWGPVNFDGYLRRPDVQRQHKELAKLTGPIR